MANMPYYYARCEPRAAGFALYLAQVGGKHPDAKPIRLVGGTSVMEVVEDHDGNTYRCVYTIRFPRAVYVLHAFQKKRSEEFKPHTRRSPSFDGGFSRPRITMKTGSKRKKSQNATDVHSSSGNVFLDLEMSGSTELMARAQLAARITKILSERKLTQAKAAELLGIDQPGVSDLTRGKLRRYSTERLFRFLGALGQEVEIRIRPSRKKPPGIRVVVDKPGTSRVRK